MHQVWSPQNGSHLMTPDKNLTPNLATLQTINVPIAWPPQNLVI